MATKRFGNISINTDDGLAFRFKDGKIHRFFGRKKPNDEDAYENQEYDPGYTDEEGYNEEDGYSDDNGYRDDEFDDDRYNDYEDDEEGEYGEDYTDDGYGDEAEDDGYGDEDYEDSYSDHDADQYDEEYNEDGLNLGILGESDTLNYILLFLLPPLGIWLLWKRGRFDGNKPVKYGLTAASAVWFVIMLILLFALIFSGSGDTTVNGNITMTTPTPTVVASVTIAPQTDDAPAGQDGDDSSSGSKESGIADSLALDATPAATALPGVNGQVAANSVYMTATGLYYHNNPSCPTLTASGNSISTVTVDVAMERGKSPCPQCYPDQKVYYATSGGKYYHVDPVCNGMKNAVTVTKEAAQAAGKKECPVCISGDLTSLGIVKYIDETWTDKSNLYVYATKGGKYFHTEAGCSGMQNAQVVSLKDALIAGKEPCKTCAAAAGTNVWCTKGGKYYHNKQDCSGMEGAYQVLLAEALVMGKGRCSTCWGAGKGIFTSNVQGAGAVSLTDSSGTVYVYATKGGTYFHTLSDCSGMRDASKITLQQALSAGKAACPTCCAGAAATAYVTPKGTYYHSVADCSGMKGASATTVAEAMVKGYKRCGTCWSSTAAGGTGKNMTVYATKTGTYYHTINNCSGMKNASAITLEQAVKAGKKACGTCAAAANLTVYSTDKGKYYHSNATCSGMKNAVQRTVEQAILRGQSACPTCMTTTATTAAAAAAAAAGGGGITITGYGTFNKGSASSAASGTPVLSNVTSSTFSKGTAYTSAVGTAGTITDVTVAQLPAAATAPATTLLNGSSGISVWATASGAYYHLTKSHAGSGAVQVPLETAMMYGKSACSTCAAIANRTVYAAKGDRYYHFYAAHAGSGAVGGKLAYALAYGLQACPDCVQYTQLMANAGSVKQTFTPGTSGIKVYATITGKYYHVNAACAGTGAAHVTLETALNYGKTPCPNCSSLASKVVYAVYGGPYYHSSPTHAGSGAVSGSLGAAMAAGMHACPVCILGSEAYEVSDIKYNASRDTSVFIDLDSELQYYHRVASCANAGMSSGTRVMLEFAITWSYKACPFCNPPTGIS